MAQTRFALAVIGMGMLVAMASCESPDERLAEYARQAMDQQARQNEALARQSQQVVEQSTELASTAQSLVEQDASARREMLQAHAQLQSELHAQRQGLDSQRNELDKERQAVAAAGRREPVIAQAMVTVGLILAAILPLLVTAYALCRLPNPGPSESLLAEALIESLAGATLGTSHERLSTADDGNAPRLDGPSTDRDPGSAAHGSSAG